MTRLNLLVTRIKHYVDLLQVQLKIYEPGTEERKLIQDELDQLEYNLEFMLSIEDHIEKERTKNGHHLTLIK